MPAAVDTQRPCGAGRDLCSDRHPGWSEACPAMAQATLLVLGYGDIGLCQIHLADLEKIGVPMTRIGLS